MTSEYPAPTTPVGQSADALYQQGFEAYSHGQFGAARHLLEQSLPFYREAQHTPGLLRALHILGNIACEEGHYTTARTLHEEVLAACRAMDFQEGSPRPSITSVWSLARKANLLKPSPYLKEAIQIYHSLGRTQEATAAQANLEALRKQQEAQPTS